MTITGMRWWMRKRRRQSTNDQCDHRFRARWSLDLFDLFYSAPMFAPVIGARFFPSTHATLSLAAVYASFAGTLLMRPIGSAVFGHYADVHGRKGANDDRDRRRRGQHRGFRCAADDRTGGIARRSCSDPPSGSGRIRRGVVASTHTIELNRFPRSGAARCQAWWAAAGRHRRAIGVHSSPDHIGRCSRRAFAQWGWRFMFFSGL